MDKISCWIKKLLVLWPDPGFLSKKRVNKTRTMRKEKNNEKEYL